MRDMGEDYVINNHQSTVNKIAWDVYAHIELPTEIQLAFSRVRGQVVRFSTQKILAALPNTSTLVDILSIGVVITQTPIGHLHFGKYVQT